MQDDDETVLRRRHDPTEDAARTEYEVGYRKPPRHTRFRPGQSGNPRGRPKGTPNFATVVQAVFNRRVKVVEGGRRKVVPVTQVLLHRYLENALKGDLKAARFIIDLLQQIQPLSEQTDETGTTRADQEILAAFPANAPRSDDHRPQDPVEDT